MGGGGGFETYSVTGGAQKVQARGTAGGTGAGGVVAISLVGTDVLAINTGSAGILAQSDGQSSGPIQISLDANSRVVGGLPDPAIAGSTSQQNAAAIRLLGGTGNQIVNAGTISGM